MVSLTCTIKHLDTPTKCEAHIKLEKKYRLKNNGNFNYAYEQVITILEIALKGDLAPKKKFDRIQFIMDYARLFGLNYRQWNELKTGLEKVNRFLDENMITYATVQKAESDPVSLVLNPVSVKSVYINQKTINKDFTAMVLKDQRNKVIQEKLQYQILLDFMDQYIQRISSRVSIAVVGSFGLAENNINSEVSQLKQLAKEIKSQGTDMDCKLIGYKPEDHAFLFATLCDDIEKAFSGNIDSFRNIGFLQSIKLESILGLIDAYSSGYELKYGSRVYKFDQISNDLDHNIIFVEVDSRKNILRTAKHKVSWLPIGIQLKCIRVNDKNTGANFVVFRFKFRVASNVQGKIIHAYVEFLDISCCHVWDDSYLTDQKPKARGLTQKILE